MLLCGSGVLSKESLTTSIFILATPAHPCTRVIELSHRARNPINSRRCSTSPATPRLKLRHPCRKRREEGGQDALVAFQAPTPHAGKHAEERGQYAPVAFLTNLSLAVDSLPCGFPSADTP